MNSYAYFGLTQMKFKAIYRPHIYSTYRIYTGSYYAEFCIRLLPWGDVCGVPDLGETKQPNTNIKMGKPPFCSFTHSNSKN